MAIWLERTPRFFNMLRNGYLRVTFFLKIGLEGRNSQQTIIFQVKNPSGSLGTVLSTAPTDEAGVFTVQGSAWQSSLRTQPELGIEGFLGLAAVTTNLRVVSIGREALSTFLSTEIISRCRNLQTRLTVFKKVRLEFYISKEDAGVGGNGTLKALRNYNRFDLSLPASVCGNIDGNSVPARGAIAFNMYAGDPTENAANEIKARQQDKPGRFLVRGCAATQEEALRGDVAVQLATFLTAGNTIVTNSVWSLEPVVEVMDDLWNVRASTSAGYVRLASQKGLSPTESALPGGGA